MKRINQLTELSVENARPAAARRELPDGGGLYLLSTPAAPRLGRCATA